MYQTRACPKSPDRRDKGTLRKNARVLSFLEGASGYESNLMGARTVADIVLFLKREFPSPVKLVTPQSQSDASPLGSGFD